MIKVKIMLNPCSGLTYSPARADVIVELQSITPTGLNKFFSQIVALNLMMQRSKWQENLRTESRCCP